MAPDVPPLTRRTAIGATASFVALGALAGCVGANRDPNYRGRQTSTDHASNRATTDQHRPEATDPSGEASSSRSTGAVDDSFADWMAGVENYDGVADETGTSDVAVAVGASGNGGNFAFDPPAVRVSTGTTVTWEWTGKGGVHDVVAKDGAFEADLSGAAGHTFEHVFDEDGTYEYYCQPHRSLGMKGVVVVE